MLTRDDISALVRGLLPAVMDHVSELVNAIAARVEAIEERPPVCVRDGMDGKDGSDGRDGKDGEPGRDGIDGKNGRDGVDGKDGVDGTNGADGRDGEDGAPGTDGVAGKDGTNGIDGKDGEVGRDGRNGDPGRDGVDGTSGKDGADGRDGKDGDPGRDGVDGTNGKDGIDGKDGADGRDGIDGKDGRNGSDGSDGKDGRDGRDGRDGIDGRDASDLDVLPAIDFAKVYGRGTLASHRGGLWRAFTNTDGEHGWACIVDGVDGIAIEAEERGFVISITRSTSAVQTYRCGLPVMIYRGVYEYGRRYEVGDVVTFGGSAWHCNAPTGAKPDEHTDDPVKPWTLAVKRGRDGKDAAPHVTQGEHA